MSTAYNLFPDRREPEANWITHAHGIFKEDPSPDEALERLRRIDWRHPALVVYREDGDDRWSYVMVGLSTPELDGD